MARDINASIYHGTGGPHGVRLTLTMDGQKYRADGYGYDMIGTVWGQWLTREFQAELVALAEEARLTAEVQAEHVAHGYFDSSTDYYGLYFTADDSGQIIRAWVNGATGFNCVARFAQRFGVTLAHDYRRDTNTRTYYSVTR